MALTAAIGAIFSLWSKTNGTALPKVPPKCAVLPPSTCISLTILPAACSVIVTGAKMGAWLAAIAPYRRPVENCETVLLMPRPWKKGNSMTYYIATKLQVPFDEAITRTEAALKSEGFGVISRIDIQQTLKAKIDVDFRPYTILGACNPTLAHEALLLEDKVGAMLPCNVVVQQSGAGEVEVAAIDPVASMQAIDNPELAKAAQSVREKLSRVIALLSGAAAS